MKFYLYKSTTIPSPQEIHNCWSILTKNSFRNTPEAFKIIRDGKFTTVGVSNVQALDKIDVSTNNTFTLLREVTPVIKSVENDQIVTISGIFAYSVHQGQYDRCPIDAFGRIKPEYKKHFLDYLQRTLGVDIQSAYELDNVDFTFLAEEHDDTKKVWFNDIIQIHAVARVIHADTVQSLQWRNIGRRRSYGFGHLVVQ